MSAITYHLKPNGNPGLCKAASGNCPYSSPEEHYETLDEARQAYEKTMSAQNNIKIRKTRQKTITAKIYRSGRIEVPRERGIEKDSYARADAFKPETHLGRTEAIFASPTIEGVVRWARGNAFSSMPDPFVRELTVDPTKVYVYSVEAWEDTSWGRFKDTVESYQKYWATGMPLQEWNARAGKEGFDPREWEVLLTPEAVVSVKPVSLARLKKAAKDDYEREELARYLKK